MLTVQPRQCMHDLRVSEDEVMKNCETKICRRSRQAMMTNVELTYAPSSKRTGSGRTSLLRTRCDMSMRLDKKRGIISSIVTYFKLTEADQRHGRRSAWVRAKASGRMCSCLYLSHDCRLLVLSDDSNCLLKCRRCDHETRVYTLPLALPRRKSSTHDN